MRDSHHMADLMATGADLMEQMKNTSGLRIAFHPHLQAGIRLMVCTGRPYGEEISPLDRVSLLLGTSVDLESGGSSSLGIATIRGIWQDKLVNGSHMYGGSAVDPPCTRDANDVARRIRTMIPWAQEEPAKHVESVHFYDENDSSRIHVVIRQDGSLEEALTSVLRITSPLQYVYSREHEYVAHGSALLDDGTAVSLSSVS